MLSCHEDWNCQRESESHLHLSGCFFPASYWPSSSYTLGPITPHCASAQHAGLERMLLSLCIGDKLSFLGLASTTNTVLKICFTETFSHLYLWKNPCSLHYWGLITLIFHGAQFNSLSRRIQRGRQNMCVQFTFMNPPQKKQPSFLSAASLSLLIHLWIVCIDTGIP